MPQTQFDLVHGKLSQQYTIDVSDNMYKLTHLKQDFNHIANSTQKK